MNTLKVNIPDGYEIDVDNTDLATGEIKLRPIKKQLPKTWDEFCKQNHEIKAGESFITNLSKLITFNQYSGERNKDNDKYILPNRETAEAMLALCQLIQLRDYYNDGWKPNWKRSGEEKYIIYVKHNDIKFGTNTMVSKILSFKTSKLRDEFFENFRDLIEIAKPLI